MKRNTRKLLLSVFMAGLMFLGNMVSPAMPARAEVDGEEARTIAERLGAPQTVMAEPEDFNEYIRLTMQAKVTVPDATHVSIVEAYADPFTEEEMRAMAAYFTGEDAAYYEIRQLSDYSKDELLAAIERSKEIMAEQEEISEQIRAGGSDFVPNDMQQMYMERAEEYLETASEEGHYEYKDLLEADETGWFSAETMKEGDIYWINGNTEGTIFVMNRFSRFAPEEECHLTREEAEETVQALLKDWGLEGEYAVESAVSIKGEDNQDLYPYITEWKFTVMPQVDSVIETYVNHGIGFYTDENGNFQQMEAFYQYEWMFVYVNDSGITEFSWYNRCRRGEELMYDTDLISFERIQDAFYQSFAEDAANTKEYQDEHKKEGVRTPFWDWTLTDIRFGYMRVTKGIAEEGEADYIMVPVWTYLLDGSQDYTFNAIDGSRMDRGRGY